MAKPFSRTRRIQFAETDLAGVLHFSNYYRLMEETEHAFLRSIGLSVIETDGDRTISWPRVATSCEYLAPARFEDELNLVLRVTHVGRRSVAYDVEFLREGERIAKGHMAAACCLQSPSSFKSIAIPSAIREKLCDMLEAEPG